MDIQVVLALATLVGSIAIAWGVSVAKQRTLEIKLGVVESEHKADHDLLIEIKTKLDAFEQLHKTADLEH